MVKKSKARLTTPRSQGKGRGRGGAGAKAPASTEAKRSFDELVAERWFKTNRYLSLIAHYLRRLDESRPAVAGPKAHPQGDGQLSLSLNVNSPQYAHDIPQPTDVSQEEPQCDVDSLDPDLAAHLFGAGDE